MRVVFFILLATDLIVLSIFLYFFAEGLGDGTVSSRNMVLWIATLAGLGLTTASGVLLHRKAYPVLACLMLAVIAVPAFLFLGFILWAIIYQPRWN
jgi:hypothetical protein